MAKDELDKLFKDGLIKYGNSPDLVIKHIPSGLEQLDALLGDGVPLGKIIQFYGPESTAKTLLCQYIMAAIQKSENPDIIYFDLEDSFDPEWWAQSGIDLDKMMISAPATGEETIDIIVALLNAPNMKLGAIMIDSLAGMIPQQEADPDRSAEDKTMGLQAKLITLLYRKLRSGITQSSQKPVILMTNQMRDSLGTMHDEIGALPGGHANRHFTHILLRTRRHSWITEGNSRVGFNIEVISRKNKLAKTADGASIVLPYTFNSQVDILLAYLEEAVERQTIILKGPYYNWGEKKWLGKNAMRDYFRSNPEDLEKLRNDMGVSTANVG
jgi:recombination protein RecA